MSTTRRCAAYPRLRTVNPPLPAPACSAGATFLAVALLLRFIVSTSVAQVPAWTTVLRGGAEAAAGRTAPFDGRSAALFLCYPPPKSPMALQCLRSFAGDVVAYVGNSPPPPPPL